MPEATCAADGTPVVLTLAALCDADAGSPAQYALAAGILLDDHLPRDAEQYVTIVVDVGGVKGGANQTPKRLIPIIRELSRVLSSNFPERVRRIIIFPVPFALRSIWVAVKLFLDPVTASKVVAYGCTCGCGVGEKGTGTVDGTQTGVIQMVRGTGGKAVLLAGGGRQNEARYPPELSKYVDVNTIPFGNLYGLPDPSEDPNGWANASWRQNPGTRVVTIVTPSEQPVK
eukprot:CAMPEP_0181258540 /NCGR_PEP_ID=MMETSP1096-20121128/50832_1 /TAXON_ID=156174 ORGANISM="Chrysochromulina ericina, Strain CCMP281" /NCGR_SAMPLE_ID=MMETSP1096 /ASSEMBLY_ACC=CAM_ASM_000453 /LENGTH=228 /DNA_ID=CAMNT_0023356931 /DNA_START=1 /DNA_END=688 /DNA_ORIENTATION=+